MKINLLRQSMNPLEKDKVDEMMNDYRTKYDEILSNAGGDMQSVHLQVEEMIVQLREHYKNDMEVTVELPTSGKQWKELLSKHGTIALGTHVDTGKLCLMVMDADDTGISY